MCSAPGVLHACAVDFKAIHPRGSLLLALARVQMWMHALPAGLCCAVKVHGWWTVVALSRESAAWLFCQTCFLALQQRLRAMWSSLFLINYHQHVCFGRLSPDVTRKHLIPRFSKGVAPKPVYNVIRQRNHHVLVHAVQGQHCSCHDSL